VKARELSDGDVLDGSGEPYEGSTDCCYHGGNWPSVEARGSTCRKVGRHMEDLLQIIRSVPCRPDSGIGFPDVATMKAWKKLTAILKA
jgi:hypothetical protein